MIDVNKIIAGLSLADVTLQPIVVDEVVTLRLSEDTAEFWREKLEESGCKMLKDESGRLFVLDGQPGEVADLKLVANFIKEYDFEGSAPLFDDENEDWDERFEVANFETVEFLTNGYKIKWGVVRSEVIAGIKIISENPSLMFVGFDAHVSIFRENHRSPFMTREKLEVARTQQGFWVGVTFDLGNGEIHAFNLTEYFQEMVP